ncbi:MAG: hypothetical protein M3Y05_12805, partial [Gemmatimonadota bacterium]|nr:hypothetical protein [Gemmatimonadota bacterium]
MAETDFEYTIAPSGHRLDPRAELGAVHLQVSDLARSVAYYDDVIGLSAELVNESTAVLTARGDR